MENRRKLYISWVANCRTMCLIHLAVPELLTGRCAGDEREGQMRSEPKERGHMQDWVLMQRGMRRKEEGAEERSEGVNVLR